MGVARARKILFPVATYNIGEYNTPYISSKVVKTLSLYGYKLTYNLELLGFWTLSIVRILIVTRKKKNKHDVSETGSVSVLR
jgi:hypothetical protein